MRTVTLPRRNSDHVLGWKIALVVEYWASTTKGQREHKNRMSARALCKGRDLLFVTHCCHANAHKYRSRFASGGGSSNGRTDTPAWQFYQRRADERRHKTMWVWKRSRTSHGLTLNCVPRRILPHVYLFLTGLSTQTPNFDEFVCAIGNASESNYAALWRFHQLERLEIRGGRHRIGDRWRGTA